MHVATSQTAGGPREACMLEFVGQGQLLQGLEALPDAVVLAEALPPLLAGLDADAAVGRVPDPGGLPWLPRLSFAHVGLPWTTNEFQVCMGRPRVLRPGRCAMFVGIEADVVVHVGGGCMPPLWHALMMSGLNLLFKACTCA